MFVRLFGLSLISVLLVAGGGCSKSSSPAPTADVAANQPSASSPVTNVPATDAIVRLHWLGKKRLSSETNAAHFMLIWNLPESARLEKQTLDKLSLGLFAIPNGTDPAPGQTNPVPLGPILATNRNSTLLRPLLDDLVQEESYIEVQAPNSNAQAVLAIKLSADRAGLWQTNLAELSKYLKQEPAKRATEGGWLAELQVTNSGDWTLVGYSSAGATNTLVTDFAARIQRDHVPFGARATNYWLEAAADPHRFVAAFAPSCKLPAMVPQLALTVIGDGSNVVTHGQFDFPRPLPFQLEPWNIPTNLIHDPLCSFTASRSVRPLLENSDFLSVLTGTEVPSQLYLWSQQPAPMLAYAAAPLSNPATMIDALSIPLVRTVNPWLAARRFGHIGRSTNFNGLFWNGAPFMGPFLQVTTSGHQPFLLGGLARSTLTALPAPPAMFNDVVTRSNLLYYDWEITGKRVDALLNIGQLSRFLGGRTQLPDECASLAWLSSVAPQVGHAGSAVTQISPYKLVARRKSTLGLTGVEMHLLADWLESPKFPLSLHSSEVSGRGLIPHRAPRQ